MWGILTIPIYREIQYRNVSQTNITDTFCLFTKLGLIIHQVKSVLQPVQGLLWDLKSP